MTSSLFQLPTFHDHRGVMTYCEEPTVHPMIFGAPSFMKTNHPSKLQVENARLLVCLAGRISVTLHHEQNATIALDRADRALFVSRGGTLTLEGQGADLLCLDSPLPLHQPVPPVPHFISLGGNESYRWPGHLPFRIKRMYFLSHVPAHGRRGGHAHHSLESLLFVVRGTVRVHLDNGNDREEFEMAENQGGLYIPKMYWREIDQFSDDAILVAFSSGTYSETEMIRDYGEFKRQVRQ